jgi:predicted secreted protein
MSYNQPPPPPPPPPPPGFSSAPGYGMPPKPSNYLVWSILTTLFCCLPLGIVAIIQSTKVDSLYSAGQYAAADAASRAAKKWILWGVVAAAVLTVLYIVLVVFLGVLSSGSDY